VCFKAAQLLESSLLTKTFNHALPEFQICFAESTMPFGSIAFELSDQSLLHQCGGTKLTSKSVPYFLCKLLQVWHIFKKNLKARTSLV